MNVMGPIPRMSGAMAEKARLCIPDVCPGWECGHTTFTFTRRVIAASVTIHLQCQGCGRSLGALKRAEVYNWQDLPEWDENICVLWSEIERDKRASSIIGFSEHQELKAREASQRRAGYGRWLLASPEWRTIRDRVMRRALFICEACLVNKAFDVHHITYHLGKLPPAWELRAVCRACHERLHDWTGGEG